MSHITPEQLLEQSIAAFQNTNVPVRPVDAVLLDKLRETTPANPLHQPAKVLTSRLSMFTTTWVLAASLLLATIVLLLTWNSRALAIDEVLARVRQHRLVRFQQVQVTEAQGLRGETESTVYSDLQQPRTRREIHYVKSGTTWTLLDIQDAVSHLLTNPETRTAWVGPGNKDYQSFLGGLEAFQRTPGCVTSRTELEGQAVVKYTLTDKSTTTQLWVDAKTRLPVRLEYQMQQPTPQISLNTFVWSKFVWDPALPAGFKESDAIFSTHAPPGYKLEGAPPVAPPGK